MRYLSANTWPTIFSGSRSPMVLGGSRAEYARNRSGRRAVAQPHVPAPQPAFAAFFLATGLALAFGASAGAAGGAASEAAGSVSEAMTFPSVGGDSSVATGASASTAGCSGVAEAELVSDDTGT